MTSAGQESDSLSHLEERIQSAIQLVARLRTEKEAALAEAAEAKAGKQRLAEEVAKLHAERKSLRGRLEKLLVQIDQLGAS